MNRIMKALFPFLFGFLAVFPGLCYGDEEEIFANQVEPDALIVLDLSGSMESPPSGDAGYSNSKDGKGNCTGDKLYGAPTGSYNKYCGNNYLYIYSASDACTGPFYKSSSGRVDCRKKVIAKRAIYGLLDDDKSGNDKNYNKNKIDKQDELSLGVRLGYMKFDHCTYTFTTASEDSDYPGGCNVLRQGFWKLNDPGLSNGYYRTMYELVTADIENNADRTPLAGALSEAKSYLDASKTGDTAAACRQKFVIFITDGCDNLACGANHYTDINVNRGFTYKGRRSALAAAKALKDAGYKVFVIGFGGEMPKPLVNTLNWAAYFGGTFNPDVAQVGDTSAISLLSNPCQEEAVCTNFNPSAIGYPGGSDALGSDLDADCSYSPAPDCCTLAPNDPGFKNLTGYAFLAGDATALNTALRKTMDFVKEARYSFTVASVSGARITAQNYLYEASFIPRESDPFWQGHLKKYKIDDNSGKVLQPAVLDAGDLLRGTTPRNMYTSIGGTIKAFNTANVSPTLLGYSSDDYVNQKKVVGYFRGDPIDGVTYTQENWRLGDVFHSNPVTIDPPSIYFNDVRSWNAFASFRTANKNRDWLMVLGANDGQIHAFNAGDLAERWSFIPPNLLRKLKLISHATEDDAAKSGLTHQFYVDGPVTVADVWLGDGDGYGKTADKWRTMMIVGLGKGVRESDTNSDPTYLWSNNPTCECKTNKCESDYKRKHNSDYKYYCGYYAFDVTNTSATTPDSPLLSSPTSMWRINLTDSKQGMYLDEPWSKMAIGRVKDGGKEKWVGLIGGGFSGDTKKKNRGYEDDDFETQQKRGGKGLFVVELSTGNILWSYTRDDSKSEMDYPIPASPIVLDWDNDGFIDTAYIADLGGNVWRFRFCSLADGPTCNKDNWKGSRLFNSTGVERTVFTTPSVAMDASSQLWVFWGTGNKLTPNLIETQDGPVKGTVIPVPERFFAVKDKDFTSTFTKGSLEKIGDYTAFHGTMDGWYYEFPNAGEKMLFDSSVFGGMVLFTTYTPAGTSLCANTGTGRLYALAMMPITIDGTTYNAGAGLMSTPGSKPGEPPSKDGGNKSTSLGTNSGMATTPMVSQKPTDKPGVTDLYIGTSGGGDSSAAVNAFGDGYTPPERGKPCPAGTPPALCRLAQTPPQAQIIHWRDRRLLQ